MIKDLYSVPSIDQLHKFIKESGDILSTRSHCEEIENKVSVYVSVTKIHQTFSDEHSSYSVLSNHVVYSALSNNVAVGIQEKKETSREIIEQRAAANLLPIWFYNISVLENPLLDNIENKDHCIFCNDAFVGIRNPISTNCISSINTTLSDLEIEKAKDTYNLIKYFKDDRNESPMIPEIEDFETKGEDNGI